MPSILVMRSILVIEIRAKLFKGFIYLLVQKKRLH